MTDLKSCPFCGGEAIILKADQYHQFPNTYYISCRDCSAGIGPLDTEAEAIEAWNKRAERTAKVETHTDDQQETWNVCECGTDIGNGYNHCPECGARLEWE